MTDCHRSQEQAVMEGSGSDWEWMDSAERADPNLDGPPVDNGKSDYEDPYSLTVHLTVNL
jgi:hypothetical protein